MIYHLLASDIWEKILESEKNTYQSGSLETEGFIHCSTREQLLPSASRHFKEFDELVVLEILPKKVKPLLKWEAASNGEEFPHLYGRLPLKAVENTFMLLRMPDGSWEEVH